MVRQYILNLLISIDQLINTVTGGDPDMTISSRIGRAVAEDRCVLCKYLCVILGWLDKDHCAKAARADRDEGKDETWHIGS